MEVPMSAQVIFECPTCRAVITRPVVALPPDHPFGTEDGKPAVPQGFFGINKAEYYNAPGVVLVNLSDLVGTKRQSEAHRLNGCCGLDGLDGPNPVCLNGHEIGTEKSDCWMPHGAVLLENVIWHSST
jgi:hypothetical protein